MEKLGVDEILTLIIGFPLLIGFVLIFLKAIRVGAFDCLFK